MEPYKNIEGKEVSVLLREIVDFFLRMVSFILISVKRYFWLSLLVLIVVVSGGYYKNSRSESLYSSKMVCAYNMLHQKLFGEMVLRLNNIAKSGDHHQLAEILGIPPHIAQGTKELKAFNMAGSNLHEDITGNKLPIYIDAVVTQREFFYPLQNALLNHFNYDIPFQHKRNILDSIRISEKSEYLLRSIDQLNNIIDRRIAAASAFSSVDSLGSLQGFARLIELKNELEDRLLTDRKTRELQVAVELFYGFSPTPYPNHSDRISLKKIILLALLLALALPVLLNLLRNRDAA